ncbi:chloride nucleotide-sensitive channel icln [Leptinotarsa decemlineata]|uniref:chloride nucleotide-sensitive channel icln n=1 Tax=Leptinotarsa decemlineata TaxID=7539 RepID=UPI000C2533D0|nr:methylosome subunit pICln [Leptinotarsa decemlineata]
MVIINSFKYPESDIKYQKENIRVVLEKKDLGNGTLYVSEQTLCWQRNGDVGLTIEYPNIVLHGISKDDSVYPGECVYVVVAGKIHMPGEDPSSPDADDSDAADSEDSYCEVSHECSELLLVPSSTNDDTEVVRQLYEAIMHCQELNPDPAMDMDDDSTNEDDNLYEDAEAELNEENEIMERGGGDADVDDLTRRIRDNFHDIQITTTNGHDEEEEFQDAD